MMIIFHFCVITRVFRGGENIKISCCLSGKVSTSIILKFQSITLSCGEKNFFPLVSFPIFRRNVISKFSTLKSSFQLGSISSFRSSQAHVVLFPKIQVPTKVLLVCNTKIVVPLDLHPALSI